MEWKWLRLAVLVAAVVASAAAAASASPAATHYRGAVESSPRRAAEDELQEYGSRSLPLRASVETVPLKSLRELDEERVPLRDAVEARPDTDAAAHYSAYQQQTDSSTLQQHEHSSDSSYKQYYGAAHHLNVNKFSEKLQQGNVNLEEMQQTATGGAAAARRLVVCYMQGWAAYRSPPLAFTAGLVPAACTHLHYAFATLHPDTYAVTPTDHDYDVIRGGYRTVTGLRQVRPGLRVLLSVGGAGSERLLGNMAKDPVRRTAFVESAVEFLKEYSFDGLDLHWAYPGESDPPNKEDLTALLYELREKFSSHDFILSIVLPSSRYLVDDGYELGAVSGATDYAVLQAWDMHAENRNEAPRRAVHHSPLHRDVAATATRESRFENVEFAVNYLLKKGMAKEKLVLGVPLFGRSFTLANSAISKPGAFVMGWGDEGIYTQNKGLLAYFEVCMAVREGRANTYIDDAGNPYAVVEGNQWVGFDSVQSIVEKMRFAARTGLAGAAAWSIDMDDFRGLCGEKWPLITAMAQAINDEPVRPSESQLKAVSFCERDAPYLSSDAASCAAYSLCSGGVRYPLLCEDGKLYNPATGRCGHIDAGKCVPGQSLRITLSDATKTMIEEEYEVPISQTDETKSSERVAVSSKLQNKIDNMNNSIYIIDSKKLVTSQAINLESKIPNTVDSGTQNVMTTSYNVTDIEKMNSPLIINNGIVETNATIDSKKSETTNIILESKNVEFGTPNMMTNSFNVTDIESMNSPLTTNNRIAEKITDSNEITVSKKSESSHVIILEENSPGTVESGTHNMITTSYNITDIETIDTPLIMNDFKTENKSESVITQTSDLSVLTLKHNSSEPISINNGIASESGTIMQTTNVQVTNIETVSSHMESIATEDISSTLVEDEVNTATHAALTDTSATITVPQKQNSSTDQSSVNSETLMVLEVSHESTEAVIPDTIHRDEIITETDTAEIDSEARSSDKRVVCYMTNWAFYRRGEGKFVPEHVDTRLCTHVVYAYATLTPDMLVAKEFDPWTDIDNNLYERVTSLKDVKVLLGLGGWTDSAGDKYSRLVSSGAARQHFVASLLAFLRQHQFAGLHLDWNYPVCWQSDCKKGLDSDKANFAKLIQELSSALHGEGMELGVAVSGYKEIIERSYDLPSLSSSADFLSAMTYDYHGGWERVVSHSTPLIARAGDQIPAYTIEFAIKALLAGGADPKKLLLGLAFYGQTFRLEDADGAAAAPGAAAAGPGEPGEFTKQPGMLAYYEICYRMKNLRWQTGRQAGAGPYAYSRDQWVGFDDPQSIKEKVDWALRQGLGGVTAWTVDLDDFSNRCCAEPSPLLRAANRALGRATPAPAAASCARPPAPATPAPPTTTTHDDSNVGGGGGGSGSHQHGSSTTWPSWSPAGTTPTQQTWWPTTVTTTERITSPITTTTTTTTTTERTTSPVTTTRQPAPAIGSDGVAENGKCSGLAGDYHAATGECDSYLQCVGGTWRKHRCAPGLHWNANARRCDWPKAAKCNLIGASGPTSSPSAVAPTTARPTTTLRPKPTITTVTSPASTAASIAASQPSEQGSIENGRCDGSAGDYHAATGACDSYLQCVGGTWRKQRCAPGLHWNANAKRCDWPRAAKCNQMSEEAEITPPAPSTEAVASPPSTPPAPEPVESIDIVSLTTEASTLISPSDTPAFEPEPSGDNMNDESTPGMSPVTQRPEPVVTTRTTPAITQATTPAPEPSRDGEVLENGRCDGSADGYHAATGACDSYLQCVGGTWRKQRCAPGLHWNTNAKRCDWPRAAKCNHKRVEPGVGVSAASILASPTSPPATLPPAPLTTPAVTPVRDESVEILRPGMACEAGTYHAHPRCSKFFVCVNGALVAQSCAPGLAWSRERRLCDAPARAACRDLPAAAQPSTPRTPAAVAAEPAAVSCTDGAYSSYPGDCGRYRHCLHGSYQEFRCSAGLHWNKDKQICDWPKQANCKEGGSSSGSNLDALTTLAPPPPPVPDYTAAPTVAPSSPKPTTTTIAFIDQPDIVKSPYKLVCYFTNWAWYRPGLGKYVPEDIDPSLCTHVVYGFAVLGYQGTITAHDSWADFDNRFYERVIAYKKHGIKVSLALGGWNDSAGDKYSRLVNSPAARAKFVKHAVQFLEKYGFDGLDLDWEYPKCWQVDCSKGPESDKEGFSALVRELSAEFKPRGLLLSSAVSPNKKVIDAGYDVPVLAANMDWIAVMTYDYHGQWDKKTGHVAPLYYHPEDDVTFFNANYTMHYWMEKGAPASKLVMGMPLYGQSFTLGTQWDTPPELLAKKNETGLNVPARSGGEAGEFTRAKGFLAYYEICERLKNRAWTVKRDPEGRMGPYAFRGDQWVSFDDVAIIKKKVQFIRSLNLAGGMVWALDLDDFRDRCGEGKHPLLTAIRNGLLEVSTKEELMASAALQETPQTTAIEEVPQSIDTQLAGPPSVVIAPPTVEDTMIVSPGTSSAVEPPNNSIDVPSDSSEYKVVCYFTNWAWYRPGPGKYTPGDIDPSLCTHIVYAFAVLDTDRLIIKPHDSWADIDNKFYEKVVALKSRGVKVLLGLGGWNDSAGDKYSRLVNSPAARRTFLVHALDFIEQHGFHGLDLDWEYPKCWQVDCNKGPASDKAAFSELVKELRAAFTPKGLLLSAAVSPSKRVIDSGYDVPVLSENLDWIAVMAYDYHGQWDKRTGHVAPMYVRDDDVDKTFNANFTINYWISEGAARRKLVMGLPMYGQSFSLAEGGAGGLDAATYGGGEAGDETRARGFLAFYEICERIRVRGWNVVRDASGRMGPYATKGDQWVSFDDDFMIQHKAEYIRAMGLGGGMIWALDLDDFNGKYCGCGKSPLLSGINSVLRGRQAPPPCALDDGPTTTAPAPVAPAAPATTPAAPAAPAPPPSATPEPTEPSEDNEVGPDGGSCSGNSFKPDPLDCGKYYLCNNGRYTRLPCPHPLHWNEDRCDWPSKANCPINNAKLRISNELEKASEPIMVCYFTNWAFYRESNGSFSPEDVDASLCTHVVYAWAALHPDTLTVVPRDPALDLDHDFYGKISALRLKGVKVLIGVGGWEESAGDKWSRMVATPERRQVFVRSALLFLQRWQFDGLEINWQYPVCWQSSCEAAKSRAPDRDGFSALMVELAAELRPRGLLLAAGVAAERALAERAYLPSDLAVAADWLTVAAYDYHGAWEPHTDHAAPLTHAGGRYTENVNASLSYWLEAGVPARKLVLGVPFYGQSYTLRSAGAAGVGAAAAGPGQAGLLTGVPGFLAYHEICGAVRSGAWSVSHTAVGSYAWRGTQWTSYWDVADVTRAAALAAARGVAGAAAWALDLDDWRGACGCGPHPLLRALRGTLRDPVSSPLQCPAH